VDFFDPNFTDAANIRVNQLVLNDKNRIAASDSSDPDQRGNGNVASAIAGLRDTAVMLDGTATINDFYNSLVGGLGVDASQASSLTSNYELIAQHGQSPACL
jgi:flagellar hook-associated protein 1 FlgK